MRRVNFRLRVSPLIQIQNQKVAVIWQLIYAEPIDIKKLKTHLIGMSL
jgi:hypothetical protein